MSLAEASPPTEAIPAPVRAEIVAALEKIERDHDVAVLYACESGSLQPEGFGEGSPLPGQ